MKMDYFSPQYWESIKQPEVWAGLMGNFTIAIATLLIAVATFFGVIVAGYLAYRYTKNHSKNSFEAQCKVDQLRREIGALEKIWELMDYISLSESEKAIMRFRGPEGPERQFYFHFKNVEDFILRASHNAFYKEHAGLYLPNKIRDLFFAYQGSVMGLYFSQKDKQMPEDSLIKITNQNKIDKMKSLNYDLNSALKEVLEQRYQAIENSAEYLAK